MADEDVARHYAHRRTGFHLVSYRRVAMPMFRVTLQILVIDQKEIRPIPLFILRAVDAGLKRIEDISGFLGLEPEIVKEGVVHLVENGNVMLGTTGDDRTHFLVVTPRGSATLADLLMHVPEEKETMVVVDGLTRKIVADAPLIRPRELMLKQLPEIAPYPSHTKVTMSDIYTDCNKFFQSYSWPDGKKRTFIDLLKITRTERLFRDDVLALVYKDEDANVVEVGLTVNGQISSDHERIFKRSDQAKQLGLIPDHILGNERLFAEVVGSDVIARVSSTQNTHSIKSQLESSVETVSKLREQLGKTDSESEKITLGRQLAEAQEQSQMLQSNLDSIEVRSLEVYEHPDFLRQAFSAANERLMIVSPWIRRKVVNATFLADLEDAVIKRKIEVYIGFGYPGDDANKGKNDEDIINRFQQLANAHSNFHFKRFGNTHAKILACDRKFLIVTSFNWLSFQGDPSQPFRDERGLYVNTVDTIDKCFADQIPNFDLPVAAS